MIKNIIDKLIIKEYKFKYLIFSIISGVLLGLSFQRYNFFLFAWIAFIPLIYSIYKNNFRYSILYGFITGLIYSLIAFNWMFLFLLENTKSIKASIIVAVLFFIYSSVYFVLWSGLSNFVKNNRKIIIVFFISFLWCLLEYIRNYFLSGFPINLLGYSQSSLNTIIQFADIFGIYGISFVIVLINLLLFYLLYTKEKKYFFGILIIVLSLIVYGLVRISQMSKIDIVNEVKIGVVQPNIEQNKKWRKTLKDEIINKIYTTAQFFNNKHCDIILYPETVLPRMLENDKEIQNLVSNISSYSILSLIGGKSIEDKKMYNSIFLISKNGKILDKYKKKHLILFGEYVPFENFLVRLLEKVNLTDNFTKEQNLKIYKFDKFILGINICSENYYPYLSRELVLKGATLLTTHSNDAWCDGLSYPYQHFALNVFRAIENRKYLIVASNTGISGVISPTGEIIKQTKNQEQVCFEKIVYPNNYITIHDKIGDFFVYVCLIFVIIILFFVVLENKFKKNTNNN